VDRETHDINGLRVIISWIGPEPRALDQYAEGGLPPLSRARAAKDGKSLLIEVAGDVPEARFTGRITGRRAVFRSLAPGSRPFALRNVRTITSAPFCR